MPTPTGPGDGVLHAGWLTKRAVRSASKDSWKRRWVVLTATQLAYYEGEKAARPKHALVLTPACSVRACNLYGPHELEVYFGDVTFYAAADTAAEAEAWVACIDDAITALKPKLTGDAAAAAARTVAEDEEAVAAAAAAEAVDVAARRQHYLDAVASETRRARRLRRLRLQSRMVGGGLGVGSGVGEGRRQDADEGEDSPAMPGLSAPTAATGRGRVDAALVDSGFAPVRPDWSGGGGAPPVSTTPDASSAAHVGLGGAGGIGGGMGLTRRPSEPLLLQASTPGGRGPILSNPGVGLGASSGGGSQRLGAGAVYVWGCGDVGQLGDGRVVPDGACKPVRCDVFKPGVKGSGAVAAAAGMSHALVVASSLQLYAWGDNSAGQCGVDGGDRSRPLLRPTLVPGLKSHRVLAVAAGATHTLALSEGGVLWSWGTGEAGQLGCGPSHKVQATPARVPTVGPERGTAFASIAAGRHASAAVTHGGEVYLWGSNMWGQLGLGPGAPTGRDAVVWQPRRVAALARRRTAQVAAGDTFTAFVVDGGELLVAGALGVGATEWATHRAVLTWPHVTTTFQHRPVVSRIAAGREHLAIVADASLYMAGFGWLGGSHGNDAWPEPRPVEELDMEGVVDVACGSMHTLVRTVDGRLYGLGANVTGVLGAGHTSDTSHPSPALTAEEGGHYAVVVSGADFAMGIVLPGAPGGFVSHTALTRGSKSVTAMLREPAVVPASCTPNTTMACSHTPPLSRIAWRPLDTPARACVPPAGLYDATTPPAATSTPAGATAAPEVSPPAPASSIVQPFDLPDLPTQGGGAGLGTAGDAPPPSSSAPPPPPPLHMAPPAPPPLLPAPPSSEAAVAEAGVGGSDVAMVVDPTATSITTVGGGTMTGLQRLHAKAAARRATTAGIPEAGAPQPAGGGGIPIILPAAATPTPTSAPVATSNTDVTGAGGGGEVDVASGNEVVLPAGWMRCKDAEGDTYFFCTATGESTWLLFWELRDSDGTPYFVNCDTQESQWDRPDDAIIVVAVM